MYDVKDRLSAVVRETGNAMLVKRRNVEEIYYKPCSFKSGSKMPITADMTRFTKTAVWGGGIEVHAWFYAKVDFGKKCEQKRLLSITSLTQEYWNTPQFILYIDGHIKQGMDCNHKDYLIEEEGLHDVYVYACTGTVKTSGEPNTQYMGFSLAIDYIDEDVERLYYNLLVPQKILEYCDKRSDEYIDVYTHVDKTLALLDLRDIGSKAFVDSAKKANDYIEKNLFNRNKSGKNQVACIGHTHIDVAWLWKLNQTYEKAQRSFATVIELMKRYPNYTFMSSQVPLYKAVKQECGELYEKIKERVAEGRWEPEGGMYVEADCNLTGGEGLVRQFMYGKRFFKEEFDVDSKVLWLPDVFGYSAALPQIMQKCGVNDFVTSKISWNDTNTMPYDVFEWKGIDGSSVVTHFITSEKEHDGNSRHTTYNAKYFPEYVSGTYKRNNQRQVKTEGIATVGYGDGGGGTTTLDCEYEKRLRTGVPTVPTNRFRKVSEYMADAHKDIEKNRSELPVWSGELYLEYHRGTYTSQANNKKNNRKSEFALMNVENLSVLCSLLGVENFNKALHDEMWEEVLLNQFHDILPGSSINGVYRDSDKSYEKVFDYASSYAQNALNAIAKKVKSAGILVFNPNSFDYDGAVEVDGKRYVVKNIPAKGYALVSPKETQSAVKVSEKTIENKYYKLKFDKDKNVCSIYDKKAKREILKRNKTIKFVSYEDLPNNYDAWELPEYYTCKQYDVNDVVECSIVRDCDRAGLKVVRKLDKSTIEEVVYLYDDDSRIEFVNNIDWHVKHTALKREFPLDIVTDKASCEIQFGYADRPTHRNTSWDKAKYEVCAHKYVDVSESDYGVSLINDSKFGHGLYDNDITLSLLRSPTNPDPECDMGKHTITYALNPHQGNLANSDTVKKSYFMNNPCLAIATNGGSGELDQSFSMVKCDGGLVVETVKIAEDGDGYVIRAYEPQRRRGKATFTFANAKSVHVCSMLEHDGVKIKVKDGKFSVDYKPFEIITLKVRV